MLTVFLQIEEIWQWWWWSQELLLNISLVLPKFSLVHVVNQS
jgi:hypothetical protein